MTSTEIERHTSRVVTPTVGPQEWALIDKQSVALANSDIIPKAYFRKPANVLVAALTGRQHGWDVLTAMRNGHVIEGQWGMKPEAMLGLVRRAGHSVTAEIGNDKATVTGKRGDTGDEMTFTFTLEDAVTADLVKLKDGKPFARSSSGKKLPWEQYPQMMCYWRAVGMLCRMLFSDVTLGAYSVEELGAQIDGDGQIVEVGMVDHTPEPEQPPTPLSDEMWEKIREQAANSPAGEIDLDVVLDTAFPDGRPDPMTDRDLPHFRDVFKRIVAAKVQAQKAAAEVAEPADEKPKGWVSAETGEAPAERDDGSLRKATKKQVGMVKAHYTRIGLADRKEQLDVTAGITGREVKSHNDLNAAEVSKLIDYLSTLPTHDGVSEPATEPPADSDAEIVDAEIVEEGDES